MERLRFHLITSSFFPLPLTKVPSNGSFLGGRLNFSNPLFNYYSPPEMVWGVVEGVLTLSASFM